MLTKITEFSIDRPWVLFGIIAVITAVFMFQFPQINIDTDPENMLQPDQPDRAYYDEIKKEFGIDDIVVVGIVDNNGIFRPEALRQVSEIINEIKEIRVKETELGENLLRKLGFEEPASDERLVYLVNKDDMVSLTTTKNIYSGPEGVSPEYIMESDFFDEPADEAAYEAEFSKMRGFIAERGLEVPDNFGYDLDTLLSARIEKMRYDIKDTPFLDQRVASSEGDAVAIYIPIIDKKVGYRVSQEIEKIMGAHLLEGQKWHIAGLPIAEEVFGHEMFIQMAVVAPVAFLLIMLIVYLLFRQPLFLVPVGVTAMLSVIWSMGLLIGMGFTVHIMSSMIPVFLLPIAILNSVHILSQFFDRFCETGKKRESLMWAMKRLYVPMLFTSLTSAVGFASLAMADIPPVQVFGVFVAFGIFVAWAFSLTLVPAMVNMLNEHKLACALHREEEERKSFLDKILLPIGKVTFKRAPWVLTGAVLLLVLGVVGIMQIKVNDNPVKWFKEGHPIRVADKILNAKFGGTYMTNLVLEAEQPPADDLEYAAMLESGQFPNLLNNPEVAHYITQMKAYLEESDTIGKASSVYDAAKRVRYVFIGDTREDLSREEKRDLFYSIGQPADFEEPDFVKKQLFEERVVDNFSDDEYDEFFDKFETVEDSPLYQDYQVTDADRQAVQAERLPALNKTAFRFLNWSIAQLDFDTVTKNDLDKFLVRQSRKINANGGGESIEYDWKKVNIWIQLKSGDNQKMQAVQERLAQFINDNPPPKGLNIKWTGLTYINKVWQDLMVNGMLFAVLGSFAIVFLLMLMEFRSFILGALSMIPLTLALVLSYGLMGWIGKNYDMPIAVCSALSLGLAVDFAIHFLQRYKNHYKQTGDLAETHDHMFAEPGRAILRNAIVISLGFLPLMVSSLTPYVTVGSFFSLLMLMSTLATVFVLPAAMRYLAGIVFKSKKAGVTA